MAEKTTSIGEKILQLMSAQNVSYGELSKRTNIAKSALQRYATGATAKIPLPRLESIAYALSVSPAYLMGWEDEPESAAPEPLTPAEHELIQLYRKLDENDRRETRRYISDFLLAKPKYLYEEKRGYA